jgi:Ankyrin repeats (3 copies)
MENINNILDDIYIFKNTDKINNDLIGTLEKAILNNYISVIKETFMAGETIYWKSYLCNGFFQKKYNEFHPTNCHDYICYKTAMYYALWCNTYYYSNIFYSLIEILNESSILWFVQDENTDEREKKIIKLSNSIKKIYDFIITIDCSCVCANQYSVFYNHLSMNFEKVNKFMLDNFENVLDQFESVYGFGVYNKEEKYEMKCHKSILGQLYVFSNDNDTNNNNSCYNVRNKLEYIRQNWKKYITNCDIVKILFNQQAFEYYRHHLKNKFFKLSNIIEQISSNSHIDINYTLHGNNILGLTILEQNRPELTNKLLQLNAKIPDQLNFDDILNQCDITNVKEIIKCYKKEYFGDIKTMISTIINFENMMTYDKIDIIEIFNKRNILENIDGLIETFLQSDISYNLLEKVYENETIMKNISVYDVYLCIRYLKNRELNMMLKYNNNLVNKLYDKKEPIFHYFQELKEEDYNTINILKTLLLNKANINIRDNNNNTPLLVAIKNNRIESFELLLKFGANPFVYDNDGLNSFHYTIKKGLIEIVKTLIKYNNMINKLTQNNVHPLFLAMESNNPVEITKILLLENGIDYQCKTTDGDNILFYLLNTKLSTDSRTTIFSMYIKKNIDLLESSKISMKPLIIDAVEKNLYNIVIMIMNKLLQLNEIRFQGYDNLTDIRILLQDNKRETIVVKNNNMPNFYSLVMVYLKNKNNIVLDEKNNEWITSLFFVTLFSILLFLVSKYQHKQYNIFIIEQKKKYNIYRKSNNQISNKTIFRKKTDTSSDHKSNKNKNKNTTSYASSAYTSRHKHTTVVSDPVTSSDSVSSESTAIHSSSASSISSSISSSVSSSMSSSDNSHKYKRVKQRKYYSKSNKK